MVEVIDRKIVVNVKAGVSVLCSGKFVGRELLIYIRNIRFIFVVPALRITIEIGFLEDFPASRLFLRFKVHPN